MMKEKLQQIINDVCYYESYIDAIKEELNEYGILKDSNFICNTCYYSITKNDVQVHFICTFVYVSSLHIHL